MKGIGLRVDYSELGGLFSKRVKPNRYLRLWAVRSESGGLDLNAGRSNPSHRKRIRRPGRLGRVGAARLAGNASTAAAHRRRSPNPAFPGWTRAGLGSRSNYEACVGHWCAQARGFGARDVGAAAHRRRSPNPAFPGRIRAGLGSISTYEACVGHWCAQARGFGARDMGLAAQAANLAGARRAGSSGAG